MVQRVTLGRPQVIYAEALHLCFLSCSALLDQTKIEHLSLAEHRSCCLSGSTNDDNCLCRSFPLPHQSQAERPSIC